MNANYEKIQSAPSSGIKFRTIAILAFIAFICGSIAAGWAITKYDLFQPVGSGLGTQDDQNIVVDPDTMGQNGSELGGLNDGNPQSLSSANGQNANSQNIGSQDGVSQSDQNTSQDPTNAVNDQLINERVNNIDDRLSRIDVQNQQTSNDAIRTESMLVAFAARRAVDRGAPLGYLKNELRLKFGKTNPNDVAAIITAGELPVRLSVLQNQLETATEILMTPDSDATAWEKFKKEISELFVIREAGSQQLQPNRQLARIKTALADRDVQTAIAEMKQMPGASKAQKWIDLANRYVQVQNALDSIEKTAIAMPTNLASTNGGSSNQSLNQSGNNIGGNGTSDNGFSRNNQQTGRADGQNDSPNNSQRNGPNPNGGNSPNVGNNQQQNQQRIQPQN